MPSSCASHLEFSHHPVSGKHTYNGYVGRDALEKVGHKKWNKRVHRVIGILYDLIHYDLIYIGGGNGKVVSGTPGERVRIVDNAAGITGGVKLWTGISAPEAAR